MTDYQNMDYSHLKGKTVAIFGTGIEGLEQAKRLRHNGIRVLVSLREGIATPTTMWNDEGFEIVSIYDAVDQSQVVQVW
jgi:ketol-acid reductoisomerase